MGGHRGTRWLWILAHLSSVDHLRFCSGIFCDFLRSNRLLDLLRRLRYCGGQGVQEGLAGSAAAGAVALVGALVVVEAQVLVEIHLQLLQAWVQRFAEGGGEELLLEGAVEALAEAV